jgi:hypothetical protein
LSYIGRKPTIGNFQICDAISVVNGQAAYTMQVGSVNVIPQSANHMIVSLNGTIQKPNSSYTVSGSTITFASNLVTNDVIDFIQILGDVLDLGVPSDATVTAAKLNNDIISGSTELASEPADTDEFLVSDAGTLKRIDYSLIKGGGITEADMWRLTTTITGTNGDITANLERVDDASFAKIGTGVTPSSGIFSFPSTGLYLIGSMISINFSNQADNNTNVIVKATINNSDYDEISYIAAGSNSSSGNSRFSVFKQNYLNVTNTSNVKVKFTTGSMESGSSVVGDSNKNMTAFSFIRLGDSQ